MTTKESIEIFYSYAYQDEPLQKELEKHLIILKRQGHITMWHSREITAGSEWRREIDAHLNKADLILILVSPDFLASDYCYDIEMKQALKRHEAHEACVIPVILRPADWKNTPFGKLQVLPETGEPITRWPDQHGLDKAFLDVALRIRDVIKLLKRFGSRGSVPISAFNSPPLTPEYEDSILLNTAIADVIIDRASMFYESNRYEEALSIYEQAISLNPGDAISYSGKGDIFKELGHYQQALIAYEQALRLNPGDAISYRKKGDILCKLDRPKEALVAYEQAVRLNPNDALAYRCEGHIYSYLQQYEHAFTAYEQAWHLDSNNAINYYCLGCTHIHLQQYKEALDDCEQAIRLAPGLIDAYIQRGNALTQLGFIEDILAMEIHEVSISNQNEAIAHSNRGVALYLSDRAGDLHEFEQALKLDPLNIIIYHNKCAIFYLQRNYLDMLIVSELVIRISPNDTLAFGCKELAEALLARDALAREKIENDAAYCRIGDALFNLQWYEEAFFAYVDALRLNSLNERASKRKDKVLDLITKQEGIFRRRIRRTEQLDKLREERIKRGRTNMPKQDS